MTRNMLNFLIDLVTATVMVGMVATGLLIHFVLPAGSGSRRFVWGLARHDWGEVHFWLAMAAIAIVALHLALHWQWVCTMTGRVVGKKAGVGGWTRQVAGVSVIAAMALFCVGVVWIGQRSVIEVARSGWRPTEVQDVAFARPIEATGLSSESEHLIQGYVTLQEAAKKTGIPLARLRDVLGLTEGVGANDRLGRAVRDQGLSMQEARQRLARAVSASDAEK